jgi:hypothetical protein
MTRHARLLLALPIALLLAPLGAAQVHSSYDVGTQSNANYGQVVAMLSDGDGGADYAVGAPLHDTLFFGITLTDAGRVTIVNGRTRALIRTHNGSSSGSKFGSAISVTPDCDGDGKSDYAIGAPGWSSGKGRVTVFSAATGATCPQETSPPA